MIDFHKTKRKTPTQVWTNLFFGYSVIGCFFSILDVEQVCKDWLNHFETPFIILLNTSKQDYSLDIFIMANILLVIIMKMNRLIFYILYLFKKIKKKK